MPSMRRLFLIGFVISMFAIAGCGGGDDSSSTASSAGEESTVAEQAEAPEEKTKPQVKPPKGPPPKKVVTKELEEGSGPAAKAGDQVTVQYVGVNYRRVRNSTPPGIAANRSPSRSANTK